MSSLTGRRLKGHVRIKRCLGDGDADQVERQNRRHRLSSVVALPSVILLICMGENVQDGSGDAEDRDLRLKYMYAKSTVLSVPTTTVSVTRRKQMEIQGCFREREVEEAGRQALLFV